GAAATPPGGLAAAPLDPSSTLLGAGDPWGPPPKKAPAVISHPPPPCRARQERRAELFLQAADGVAHARLTDAKLGCRPHKALALGDFHEDRKGSEVGACHDLSLIMIYLLTTSVIILRPLRR